MAELINLETVKDYNKLSDTAKKVFERVYRLHNAALGADCKVDYRPVKVKERSTHLEVHFKNGQWLHYMPNGIWY